jgi:pyrimidine-specific ribonucleoside hydrolase
MELYLRKRRAGKLLHDPTAACAAIDPGICGWAEVEMVQDGLAWGAEPAEGSGTFITVSLDRERLFATFVGDPRE